MTFEHWLKQYIDLPTPIGDLARDYKSKCLEYKSEGKKRPKLTLGHLQDNFACEEAIEAFHKARNLYSSFVLSLK